MKYKIIIEKKAWNFILTQPKPQQERILKAVYQLPDFGDITKLKGYSDTYRLRVGNYRIIYIKKDEILQITVVNAGNRGDIYKSK